MNILPHRLPQTILHSSTPKIFALLVLNLLPALSNSQIMSDTPHSQLLPSSLTTFHIMRLHFLKQNCKSTRVYLAFMYHQKRKCFRTGGIAQVKPEVQSVNKESTRWEFSVQGFLQRLAYENIEKKNPTFPCWLESDHLNHGSPSIRDDPFSLF